MAGLSPNYLALVCDRLATETAGRWPLATDLRLIVVDYTQLMTWPRNLTCPSSRCAGSTAAPNNKRTSGPCCLTYASRERIKRNRDVVLQLHRPDAFEGDHPQAGEAESAAALRRAEWHAPSRRRSSEGAGADAVETAVMEVTVG